MNRMRIFDVGYGFQWGELTVVVGVALIGLGAVLPGTLRSQLKANEQGVPPALRRIHGAELLFARRHGSPTTLGGLASASLIDDLLGAGARGGYRFELELAAGAQGAGEEPRWCVLAWPRLRGWTGRHRFLLTWDGGIYRAPCDAFDREEDGLSWLQSHDVRALEVSALRRSETWERLDADPSAP